MTDQCQRLRVVLDAMRDTHQIVLLAAADPDYPWQDSELTQQIREDLTAYDLLGLDDADVSA